VFRNLTNYIFLILISSTSFAAEINEFKDKFMTLRAYVEVPSYEIDIKSQSSGNEVVWLPNIRVLTGADISLNDFPIGGGYAWANGTPAGSGPTYGNTNYQDYRFGLTLKSFHADANYQTYDGFYVSNTSTVNPNYGPGYIQDPNLAAVNISANGTFILKPDNFSYAAALGQNARQEASGGSWLLGFAVASTSFASSNYLIPGPFQNTYGQDQLIKNVQFYDAVVTGGYGYSFVWAQRFFLSFVIDVGLGGEYRTYGDGVNQYNSGGTSTKGDGLISLGYNGDTFLAAIIATADDTTFTTASLQLPQILGDVKLAIGGHF
jgi:hypothetical protein